MTCQEGLVWRIKTYWIYSKFSVGNRSTIKWFLINNVWGMNGLAYDLEAPVDYVWTEEVIIKADFDQCRKLL